MRVECSVWWWTAFLVYRCARSLPAANRLAAVTSWTNIYMQHFGFCLHFSWAKLQHRRHILCTWIHIHKSKSVWDDVIFQSWWRTNAQSFKIKEPVIRPKHMWHFLTVPPFWMGGFAVWEIPAAPFHPLTIFLNSSRAFREDQPAARNSQRLIPELTWSCYNGALLLKQSVSVLAVSLPPL